MKSYNKSSGWLVKCIGGELDGTFVRSWCLTNDPQLEAAALEPSFSVTVLPDHRDAATWAIDTRGEYVLKATHDKKGERKFATANKVPVPASHYEWIECD